MEVLMPQVFIPVEVVFNQKRFDRTVESVLLDFDIDEHMSDAAKQRLKSYTLREHVESAVPERLREEPRERRIDRIMASLNEVVSSCLNRYLDAEMITLLRGMQKHADITLFVPGHRHFYTDIVKNSYLCHVINSGFRVVERMQTKAGLVGSLAPKKVVSYYLDTDPQALLEASRLTRRVKLGLLNTTGLPEPDQPPWQSLKTIEEAKAWFAKDHVFYPGDVLKPDPRFELGFGLSQDQVDDDEDNDDVAEAEAEVEYVTH